MTGKRSSGLQKRMMVAGENGRGEDEIMTYVDTRVIYGVRAEKGIFDDVIWGDELLPHIEGHEGVDVLVMFDDDSINTPFVGVILAEEHNDHDYSQSTVIEKPSQSSLVALNRFLKKWGIEKEPKLMLITLLD